MKKVAFFIDGNYLFNQMKIFKSFFCDGPNIKSYCERHLCEDESIYRIFYYDAPPLDREGKTPTGKSINLGKSHLAKKMNDRLQSIRETPYMALRLGKVNWFNDWIINENALKEIINGTKNGTELTDDDFTPNIQQKIVDMKIGLDIATIAFKKLADKIILIAGDSDFVPAAKLARTEGLEVIIDPLGKKLSNDLIEHVDHVRTMLDPDDPKDVSLTKKSFFVINKKSL